VEGKVAIKRILLRNILSFGDKTTPVELGPLNVLIGPNGSGKSNFLSALTILKAAPTDLAEPFKVEGNILKWFWKGSSKRAPLSISVALGTHRPHIDFVYLIGLTEANYEPRVVFEQVRDETEGGKGWPLEDVLGSEPTDRVSREGPSTARRGKHGSRKATVYYQLHRGNAFIMGGGEAGGGSRAIGNLDLGQSVLSQRIDPDQYGALTYIGRDLFRCFRFYRMWTLGPRAGSRQPQPADQVNSFLLEDASNLGLVLSRMWKQGNLKRSLMANIRHLYGGIRDLAVILQAGRVQVCLEESFHGLVPATRLSDGTLRWISLLAILLDPQPPPLVCIEEPELGLHPDLLPKLADLLREASQRMQLVITTHSDVLVDALTDTPESVIVCEKENGATTMRRLDRKDLSKWLEKYSLGQLWRSGQVGGNRW